MIAAHHLDCRNFAPVDVAKGLCRLGKLMTPADEPACERFEPMPKCKHCERYSPGEQQYLGVCLAEASRPMTYPDLNAATCEDFRWQQA